MVVLGAARPLPRVFSAFPVLDVVVEPDYHPGSFPRSIPATLIYSLLIFRSTSHFANGRAANETRRERRGEGAGRGRSIGFVRRLRAGGIFPMLPKCGLV